MFIYLILEIIGFILGGDASTASLASSQSAELHVNSYDHLSNQDSQSEDREDGRNLNTYDKVYVAKGKEGFRRGRIDYNSLGVLRTKPGFFLILYRLL